MANEFGNEDIVVALRDLAKASAWPVEVCVFTEAADEIEALRTQREWLRAERDRLQDANVREWQTIAGLRAALERLRPLIGYWSETRQTVPVFQVENWLAIVDAALAGTAETGEASPICGACGKVWDGEKCAQAENGWPFPTCYPAAPSQPASVALCDKCGNTGDEWALSMVCGKPIGDDGPWCNGIMRPAHQQPPAPTEPCTCSRDGGPWNPDGCAVHRGTASNRSPSHD